MAKIRKPRRPDIEGSELPRERGDAGSKFVIRYKSRVEYPPYSVSNAKEHGYKIRKQDTGKDRSI
jgi:hypothetical protein